MSHSRESKEPGLRSLPRGKRCSHPGFFEVGHALARQGEKPATYETLDEHYDLVVVGAGMSGLAAAWYYQKQKGADVKILVLDNHDDFGGHAKRNEFHHQGRMVLSTGGAVQVDTLSGYSEMATQLMADLGIDEDMIEAMQRQTPQGLSVGGADAGRRWAFDQGRGRARDHWRLLA